MSRGPEQKPDALDSELHAVLDLPFDLRTAAFDAVAARHADSTARVRRFEAEFGRTAAQPAADHVDVTTRRIGPYDLLSLLGRGGMGEVFKAERREPVRQIVAIKLIQPGKASREVLARFQFERQTLASMSHRSIAKVFDAGATDQGAPYFVMEFVAGQPLTTYCDEHRLPIRERLALFRQICAAVHHAHQRGVVHRDLKPGNVLVVREGDEAVAKVLDFGLAKAMSPTLSGVSFETGTCPGMGTLEYMSPEQAAGDGDAIDARTDIYALGVMLYELLAGTLPFTSEELRRLGPFDALAMIRAREPSKPSTRLTALGPRKTDVAALRETSAESLARVLRRDLDWVVLKAMAKEPERRYDSAAALAADVGRYLAHQPLEAGPPSFRYRARVFARRYRGQLVAVGAVVVALVAGLVLAIASWREATARKSEFDQLAGVVLYERAIETEKTLYPAWPRQVAALERWLKDDAGKLLSMRGQIEQTVRDLRARAEAATPEQVARDKTSHPKFAEWQKQAAKLASLERAHAIRTTGQVLTLPLPTAEEQAMTASQLNTIAWPRSTSTRASGPGVRRPMLSPWRSSRGTRPRACPTRSATSSATHWRGRGSPTAGTTRRARRVRRRWGWRRPRRGPRTKATSPRCRPRSRPRRGRAARRRSWTCGLWCRRWRQRSRRGGPSRSRTNRSASCTRR